MPYIIVDDMKTNGEQDIITVLKKLKVKIRKLSLYSKYIYKTYIHLTFLTCIFKSQIQ